jgi:hypothetical protein
MLCLVSIAVAVPSIVGAQSPTAFDGTYAGVSNTASGGGNCSPFAPVPRPLTIRNGVAQFEGGLPGATVLLQGNVSPQGEFTLKDNLSNMVIGRIDPTGKATASVNFTGSAQCVLAAVWQKQ